jgi:hypothetical protein
MTTDTWAARFATRRETEIAEAHSEQAGARFNSSL